MYQIIYDISYHGPRSNPKNKLYWGKMICFVQVQVRWGASRRMFPGPDGRREREGSLHREQRCGLNKCVDGNVSCNTLVRAAESRIDVDRQDSTPKAGEGFQRRLLALQSGAHRRGAYRDFQPDPIPCTYRFCACVFRSVKPSQWQSMVR